MPTRPAAASRNPRSLASQPDPAPATTPEDARTWTLLTSHGRVLLLLARRPDARLRDLAELARITERSASTIVRDLERAGYITKAREGRRNTYVVHPERHFRHPAEASHKIGELLDVFGDPT